MKRIMVQYKVKAERVEENQRYVEAVFTALKNNSPDGVRYATFKKEDGVSFVHIISIESADGSNPIGELPQFKAFTENIGERCAEPPVAVELEEIGAYNFFVN